MLAGSWTASGVSAFTVLFLQSQLLLNCLWSVCDMGLIFSTPIPL